MIKKSHHVIIAVLALLCALAAFLFFTQGVSAPSSDEQHNKAVASVSAFQDSLKGAFVEAMEFGGVEEAIKVCNEYAPSIAQNISTVHGVDIARTSLKVRNQGNEADEWERSVLEEFEERRSQGDAVETLETSLFKDGVYRYMKAIPTQEVCTKCHGASVDPDLYKTIKEYYAEDQAIGFKPGDIRGAFTVIVPAQ